MTLKNLLAAWDKVQPRHVEEGIASYPSYHQTLRNFAAHYQTGFVQTVEAFAALSPNNDYHANLRSLASVLHAYREGIPVNQITVSTYRACAFRAYSYVTGEVSFLDIVKGKKITAFRHNLLYPDTSQRATIDGHMIGVWHGKRMTMAEAARALSTGMYDVIEEDVKTLARKVKMPVPCVQATLWIWTKETNKVKYSSQQDLFNSKSRWTAVHSPQDYPPYPTKEKNNV